MNIDPMIIAQISDSHIDPEHENGPARLRDLEACVADINSLNDLPDVVIHTGDMAHNGDNEKYDLAFEILQSLKPPLLACPGNRDERSLLSKRLNIGQPLQEGSPHLQYAVDDFPVRLVALDTISDQSNQGAYCQDRTDGLRGWLSSHTDKPVALFMHHPPFEVIESKYPHQYDPWVGAERLQSALKDQRHVVRGFCGHAHRDTTGTVEGIPFTCVPSVARDLRLGEFEPELESTPLYHIHTFDGIGAFQTETRSAISQA
jgi:Icc protein